MITNEKRHKAFFCNEIDRSWCTTKITTGKRGQMQAHAAQKGQRELKTGPAVHIDARGKRGLGELKSRGLGREERRDRRSTAKSDLAALFEYKPPQSSSRGLGENVRGLCEKVVRGLEAHRRSGAASAIASMGDPNEARLTMPRSLWRAGFVAVQPSSRSPPCCETSLVSPFGLRSSGRNMCLRAVFGRYRTVSHSRETKSSRYELNGMRELPSGGMLRLESKGCEGSG